MVSNLVAIAPRSFEAYERAVEAAGGVISELNNDVSALIWTDYSAVQELKETIEKNPQLTWVQLPFAGVDAFKDILGLPVRFTSAKGSYKEPVAEHALALSLALARKLPIRIKAGSWGKREAFSFYDSNVLIVGGGGIAEEFIGLLRPFRAEITVVRNNPLEKLPGATKTVGMDRLADEISKADLVLVACALTEATRGLFEIEMFKKMKPSAYFVNVARGQIVVTSDLLQALDSGYLSGAAVDVTDPEPLPDNHPMFGRDDLIVTPHTADTKEIVMHHFAIRLGENVRAFLGKGPWVGQVDPVAGY